MRAWAIGAVVVAACAQQVDPVPPPSGGSWHLDVIASPDSGLLDQIERLRLVGLNGPGPETHVVAENVRENGVLSTSFDTIGGVVEGLDASGNLIAVGHPIACPGLHSDQDITVFIGPPSAFSLSPVRLSSPRSGIAAPQWHNGGLSAFDGFFAGGREVDGSVSDRFDVYDGCHQTLRTTRMPEARVGPTMIPMDETSTEGTQETWLFGGTASDGRVTASLYKVDVTPMDFDVEVFPEQIGFERTNQEYVEGLITGDVPALFTRDMGVFSPCDTCFPHPDGPLSPRTVEAHVNILGGLADLQNGTLEVVTSTTRSLALPPSRARASIAKHDSDVIVVGGDDTTVLRVDPVSLELHATTPEALSVVRYEPTVFTLGTRVVVLGGVDAQGEPIGSADVLDFWSFNRIATVPAIPRLHPTVLAMGLNVLVAGGDSATDAIEIFTPEPFLKDPTP